MIDAKGSTGLADLFSVKDKVVLVTGGTSGLGRLIAEGFAVAGAKVYVVSRKADACAATATAINELGGGECIGFAADLAVDGAEIVVERLRAAEGRLDVLVNNAGVTWGSPLADYSLEGFEKVLRLNLTSAFDLTRRLVDQLRTRRHGADPGRVINIGSVEGLVVPEWENYAYPASKAALHMLTRQLARNLAPEITVNAIAPGPFPSRMIAFAQEDEEHWQKILGTVPLRRAGDLGDIAGASIFLASRAGAYVTGEVLSVDGGLAGAGRLSD